MVIDADGVDLYIRLFYQACYLPKVVTAVIVTAVGDDEKGSPLVPCRAQFVYTQVDRVQ